MKKIMDSKKGITPRNWIYMVVFIGMLVAASAFWINEWDNKYSQIEQSNLSSSYNAISEVSKTSDEMERKLQSETAPTTIGWLDFIVTGGYQVLISVMSVPLILRNFVMDVGGQFQIPRIFIDGIVIMITIGAVFGIISAIFRRKT